MKPGARYIRSTYVKIGDESALVTLCLGEQFHCLWECSCGIRGKCSDGTTADQTTVVCQDTYKAHCESAHPENESLNQLTIVWRGGAWDGYTLSVDRTTAQNLLGKAFRCPSRGAPFMIFASDVFGLGPLVTYQADGEMSYGDVLYMRQANVTS